MATLTHEHRMIQGTCFWSFGTVLRDYEFIPLVADKTALATALPFVRGLPVRCGDPIRASMLTPLPPATELRPNLDYFRFGALLESAAVALLAGIAPHPSSLAVGGFEFYSSTGARIRPLTDLLAGVRFPEPSIMMPAFVSQQDDHESHCEFLSAIRQLPLIRAPRFGACPETVTQPDLSATDLRSP